MKHITIFIFTLLVSMQGWTQSKFGIVAFPQISALTNHEIKDDSVNKNLPTLSGGAGINYTQYFSKRVSIQVGLLYSSQNQKFKSTYRSKDGNISIDQTGKKRFDYLKVPVVLRYSFPLSNKLNLVPFAGIQLSYLLKYDGGMVVYGDNYFDMPATPSGNNFYKKTIVNIPLGLNVEFALTPKTELVFGAKFDYALTNATNNNATYLGAPITSYAGVSSQTQRHVTYGLNMGLSFNLTKKEKTAPTPNKAPMLANAGAPHKAAHHHSHHNKKDTVTLEGKHHHHRHASQDSKTGNPVASSSRDHVGDMFNKSYTSLIKGVVYKKGTSEILNNTKIILETEEEKVDSSITAIGGMYTLHVQNRTARHQMYVYKKGYKPLLIDIPDTLLDKHQVSVVKIQLEPDGSDHQEERIMIVLKGRVRNATGKGISGASLVLKNNVDKSTQQIVCDENGQYKVELKKYAHYTVSAIKGGCESEKANKSTLSVKESTTMEMDLTILCP